MSRARALTPLYYLYAGVTALAAPVLQRGITRKMQAAGVAKDRIGERFGRATAARAKGPLIWFHAVSLGELFSILGLIDTLLSERPDCRVLVTTTTVTSAELAAKRLPEGAVHQFSPLDTPGAVRRFLRHWKPDLAAFVESEIWPRQIVALHRRGIPLMLINARLSDGSLRRWRKVPGTAAALLDRFQRVLTQTATTRDAVVELGMDGGRVSVSGDLKSSADKLPVDGDDLAKLHNALGDRPVWAALSTHPGEEEKMTAAHRIIREKTDALLLLQPRHPERADKIEGVLIDQGWTVVRRSSGVLPNMKTDIYLVDTLGETGLLASASNICFVAGSFTDVGGHNPYEAAQFGCAILHGPYYANAQTAYEELDRAGGGREVADASELAGAVIGLLDGVGLAEMQDNARRFAKASRGVRAEVAQEVLAILDQAKPAGAA